MHLLGVAPTDKKVVSIPLTNAMSAHVAASPGAGSIFAPDDIADEADHDEQGDTLHPLSSSYSAPGIAVSAAAWTMRASASSGSIAQLSRHAKTPDTRSAVFATPPVPSETADVSGQPQLGGVRNRFGPSVASLSSLGMRAEGSAHSFATSSSGDDVGLPLHIREASASGSRIRLSQYSALGSRDTSVLSLPDPVTSPPRATRPLVPYQAGVRMAYADLHRDQPQMPPPRFCGQSCGLWLVLLLDYDSVSECHSAVLLQRYCPLGCTSRARWCA